MVDLALDAGESVEQIPSGAAGHLVERLADGRERREGIGGKILVVEPDQREVIGDAYTTPLETAKQRQRVVVAGRDQRIGRARQHMLVYHGLADRVRDAADQRLQI